MKEPIEMVVAQRNFMFLDDTESMVDNVFLMGSLKMKDAHSEAICHGCLDRVSSLLRTASLHALRETRSVH